MNTLIWFLCFNFSHVSDMFAVCDDTCKEVIADPANELLVCTISGRCFDRLLSPAEMEPDAVRNIFIAYIFMLEIDGNKLSLSRNKT